ncbi:enoyl-CoA hydratase/isomerase family protein [Rhodococcus erythropolis]|uniref:enoyl-CoA hydratase/isomerase family protein n=1 Tax=Rhodococcus erythropolis TaxID=1833 RepID=UPI001BED08DC|nr:enoyl-CoA hydratase/isomerase family protein [Rhodococcus erythropolis]MBT2266073.1 enoyl-CoA hydratase/isomerase family protein [Rhodococcus erythropolis]
MIAPAPLLIADAGPVRTLTLNRPDRRNALDPALIEALDAAIADAEAQAGVGCLVLAGAGKSFCAGADLQYFLTLADAPSGPTEFLRRVSAVVTRLERSRLPVVAAVHGHAVAGGLELALACDVVVASDDALIGDGHIRKNLLPAAGSSVRLPRKVGDSMARWLALTGTLLPAEELRFTGWLHAVVPPAELTDTASALAAELAAAAGPAQSAFKSLLHSLTGMHEEDGLATELVDFERHWNSADVPAVLTAFLHDRPA